VYPTILLAKTDSSVFAASHSGGNGLYHITHTGSLATLFSMLLIYSHVDEENIPRFLGGLVDLIYYD